MSTETETVITKTTPWDCKLMTTQEAARLLGVKSSRLRQICAESGLGRKLGRDWVFTPATIAAIRKWKKGE